MKVVIHKTVQIDDASRKGVCPFCGSKYFGVGASAEGLWFYVCVECGALGPVEIAEAQKGAPASGSKQ